MNWQDINSRASLSGDILFLPPSAKTVSQKEIEALEAKRIRRLRELGKWRPSRGWQIEPNTQLRVISGGGFTSADPRPADSSQ